MNIELFIARRIIFSKSYSNKISEPVIKISIAAIALGIAVMIIAVSVVTGFQNEIRNKVIGFGSHIQITRFSLNRSYESMPMLLNDTLSSSIQKIQGVRHIQQFATKAGIIKTEEEIYGALLKGIGFDFDWTFFNDKIIDGDPISMHDSSASGQTIISKYIANKLNLSVGDHLHVYFIQDPPRARNFTVSGIYETGLEELDKLYILVDIRHIQKLNDWDVNEIGGYEVLLDNDKLFNSTLKSLYLASGIPKLGLAFASTEQKENLYKDNLDKIWIKVYAGIGYNLDAKTIKQLHSQIFDWLELQNVNVQIIIILMLFVAGINMISALLILILEKTNMIGILKAMGSKNTSIRKIFMYNAAYLIIRGLFWGNLTGILLCFLQHQFKIIPLDEQSYFVSSVPIDLNWLNILILNTGSLIICMLMLIIPSGIISRISPVKAIRFN
jgi:lipoprotein-releasing system permease protein